MVEEKIFVGRKAELEQFGKVLDDPKGQAVLVVGQAGMGKTWLVNKMAEIAENHPELKCGWVRYEVTPTDSVDSTMALMMDNAFEAAQVKEGSFDGTPRSLQQWKALLNLIKIGDLVMSMWRDPAKNTREQFLERLGLISKRMPEDGRAVFIIDPEKYMQKESDQSWAIVVKQLPEKIKFVFAQRPEDKLVESETFSALKNVIRIPSKKLREFTEKEVEELYDRRAGEVGYSQKELREGLGRYKGHPYALQAALDLVAAGVEFEKLPSDPTDIEIAKHQRKKIWSYGDDIIHLFESYAVLEVAVPSDVAEKVSVCDSIVLERVLEDNYLGGLLREEADGRRIYHTILADYIRDKINKKRIKEYHGRAVRVYREKLAEAEKNKTKPDALAAMRLPEHVLEAEGKEAFVYAFINECYTPLSTLGLLDAAIALSERALELVENGSEEEAALCGNLGLVYQTMGYLDKAEEMFTKILDIHKKLGHKEGMALDYGNVGLVYRTRGDLDKAEEMHKKSLEIAEKLGIQEEIARQYGNLGIVYRTRGDLDEAKEMHKKSLEIEKKSGWLEGIAAEYGNLGLVYQTRGELDKAEEMHKKSLEINEKLGRKEGVASDYGNLGLIYQDRGELDKAEEMHKKSLEIDKKLGRLEGMANSYGNLGLIYMDRGELDKAEEMHKKSLEIKERVGLQEGMANSYGNLGLIYQKRGDLDKAEEMQKKALEIDKKIGRLEGQALRYGNLGNVYYMRGELDKAEEMYKKSLEIGKKLGLLEVVASEYGNLGRIYKKRGDIAKAREYWEKAVELYKRIGMPHMVEKVEGLIEGLSSE